MKKLVSILAAFAALVSASTLFAQGKYGADSAECIKYLSYYQEYYKQKNYDDATPNWRKAYSLCPPTASQNMLIHGSTLITRLISKNGANAEYKQALVDTLLAIQDKRVATYPKSKVTVLNNKGQYIVNYMSDDPEFVYANLSEIANELGNKMRPSLFESYIRSAIQLYQSDKMEADNVIGTCDRISSTLASVVPADEEEAGKLSESVGNVESLFAQSKVASCDNLIRIFTPRYEANPDDIGVVSNIVKLMNSAEGCLNNDLYLKAVTSMHKIEPSHSSAYFLYKLHSARNNDAEAVRYLEEAISTEGSDAATDASYYYELANFCLKNGMKGKAFDAARKAADLGYGFTGKAYFLIGTIWGSTSCGGNEVTRRAPYWVAVDYLQKAKANDPSLAEDANRLIGSYSAYFPQTADAFMYDLSPGQSYTVSCSGMSATTTVRTSK